jgi:hypothetical protein
VADDDEGTRGVNSDAVRAGDGLMKNESSAINLKQKLNGVEETCMIPCQSSATARRTLSNSLRALRIKLVIFAASQLPCSATVDPWGKANMAGLEGNGNPS